MKPLIEFVRVFFERFFVYKYSQIIHIFSVCKTHKKRIKLAFARAKSRYKSRI